MKKEYIKPEVEMVSLIATEAVTESGGGAEGEEGMESSIF